jgi:hypothetical protein
MSDKNDFDFDDDFLNDDNEPFDFDEEEGFPSGLGDELGSDMPEIEEEPEERGANRTFVFLAGIMIILFVVALGVVLFLATRPTGPSDLELTASQVVLLNLTVEAQLAGTSTQNAINQALTLTAAAWTATPSPTLTPTVTDTPEPSITPSATEFHPTVTPTPSQDLTQLAIAQLANGALTLTALAGQATLTPTPAPSDVPVELNLQTAFATQLAYATQEGMFDQDAFGTRVAFATQNASNASLDSQAEQNVRSALQSTQTALDNQLGAAQTAIAYIDSALQSSAVQNSALATQLAQVIPAGLQTQAALGTPFAQATLVAAQTQSALGTLMADINSQLGTLAAPASSKLVPPSMSRAEQATEVARLPLEQVVDATQAVIQTRDSFSTQAAQSTRSALSTQAALATQMSFLTPPVFATQAGIATQVALATRKALIDMALGLQGSPTPGGGGLESVNMTATAIAGAFLTATAQAVTPGAEVITAQPQQFPTAAATALPQTGMFDDVVSGGSGLGVLALTVVGLVGVIVVSRRLRGTGSDADEPQEPPKAG